MYIGEVWAIIPREKLARHVKIAIAAMKAQAHIKARSSLWHLDISCSDISSHFF